MAAISLKEFSVMLVAVLCMALLVLLPTGHAQLSPEFETVPTSSLHPLPSVEEIKMCWESLRNIKGCVDEVFRSIFSGQLGIVGPACCNAVIVLNENCWPKLFPLIPPTVPHLLKSYCVGVGGAAPAPKEA